MRKFCVTVWRYPTEEAQIVLEAEDEDAAEAAAKALVMDDGDDSDEAWEEYNKLDWSQRSEDVDFLVEEVKPETVE